ncbi:MAG: 16S rRNA (adenine(1518)-N(6)/adenine(1519)-N(6))-dimethyltransferase RsmA [Eggerthellaceae bacterium]
MPDKLSPLASVSATREVLQAHGLATKKALGQHFLISDGVVARICATAELSPGDVVLEVGPGIGTLSIALLKCAGQVIAVERDKDLPAVLAHTCAEYADRFTLISKDALALTQGDLPCAPRKFVANLPYAVAATLVLDFFERFESLDSATVMVQAEVADRMCAHASTKTYGAYTVKLSLFAQPTARFSVAPGNFFPPPRVESSVLRLDRCTPCDAAGTPLDVAQVRATCMMADAAFTNRRKTLANSCKTYFAQAPSAQAQGVREHLDDLFAAAEIDPKRRGETLSQAEFIALGVHLSIFLEK